MKVVEKARIENKLGLHLRAAAELVKVANKFKCQITVSQSIQHANAKSLMGLLTLAATKDTEIEIAADGDDAKEAVAALRELIAKKFGEKE
jgi:phosphocarrier protein